MKTLYLLLLISFLLALAFVFSAYNSRKVEALDIVIEETQHIKRLDNEVLDLKKSTDEVMYQTYEIMYMVEEDPFIGTDEKICSKKSAR